MQLFARALSAGRLWKESENVPDFSVEALCACCLRVHSVPVAELRERKCECGSALCSCLYCQNTIALLRADARNAVGWWASTSMCGSERGTRRTV